ncbi:protein ANTAGONIST OF LIKE HETEROCHROMATIN PROTEIN 1-like [Thrips palmi]|uniref:Protein ANTAGONIST OF LIKE HETEROCHROMATIN PROTEIN 1-like n=1 Tax=Thrips palmi TaxID=161013 RepID=A0A6P8Z6U1_THRPL|nr:protein ANTAGONIST OF LIKE HETEROCHROMATIN PROTEIN 1-like [Thrips palmi]
MMEAARIAANEWMEMEEGVGLGKLWLILMLEIFVLAITLPLTFNSTDELESWQHVTVNIDDYHNMNDRCFRLHFRMSKHVFGRLVQIIEQHLEETGRLRRRRTPLRDIVLMVVWQLATPDTFRSVALRFGVTPSTLYYFYSYIIQALREMAGKYIVWPNEEERVQISETFRVATGFPGVVGSVDGTHVYVTAPVENAAAYKNRFLSHSILVQAVVDSTLLVRDFSVGEPGSMNDNRVFRRSELFRDILAGERLSQGEFLVGDGAYTLSEFVRTDLISFLFIVNQNSA